MTEVILAVSLFFIVYFIGYAMGRKDVIDDIRQMTKELKDKDEV